MYGQQNAPPQKKKKTFIVFLKFEIFQKTERIRSPGRTVFARTLHCFSLLPKECKMA